MRFGLMNPAIGNGGGAFEALVEIVESREIAHGQIEYKVRRYMPHRRAWTRHARWGCYSLIALPIWIGDLLAPLRQKQLNT